MKSAKFKYRKIIISLALVIFAFNLALNAMRRLPGTRRRSPGSINRSPQNKNSHENLQKDLLLAYLISLQETGSTFLSDREIKQMIRDILKKDINNDLKQKIKKEVTTLLDSDELKEEIIALLRTNCEDLLEFVHNFIEKAKWTFLDDKLLNDLLNYGKLDLYGTIPTFITYLEGTDEFNEYREVVDTIDQTIFDDIFLQKIIINIFSKFTTINELDLSNNGLIEIPTHISELIHLEVLDLSDNQILSKNLNTKAIADLKELKSLNLENDYDEEDFPETIVHLFKDKDRNIYIIEKEFIKKSIANETTRLFEFCKYDISLFFRKNNTTDTNQVLSQKTDALLKKIKETFCNEELLEKLVQFKSLNLSNAIPYTGVINANKALVEQFIFEQLIFDQIIIGIYSRWIPIFNLDLSDNSLVSIPQNLHLLRNLEKCDLSGNAIENINTDQIKKLEYLEYLNLTSCFDQITTFGRSDHFPKQIGHLTIDENENIYRFIN